MNCDITIRTRTNITKHIAIQPGGEYELFFSNSTAEPRAIGHMRFDFGNGKEFWHSWWPHSANEKDNTKPFRDEHMALMDYLREHLFPNSDTLRRELKNLGIPEIDESRHYYGFHVDTDSYSYYIRIYPYPGDYSYCYCYLREGGKTQ